VWKPLRDKLGAPEPPYGLRHSYASLRIREGASITELAEELGHSPQMTLNTYAHVIDELRGAPRLPTEQEIARARSDIAQREYPRLTARRPLMSSLGSPPPSEASEGGETPLSGAVDRAGDFWNSPAG
jgi:hypothetical protein